MTLLSLLSRLPERFRWTLHNTLGHPVSELLALFGLADLADIVHDGTLP